MITWVDVLLVIIVATLAAAGAHKRLIGLFVGVGGVLLLRPLLGVGASDPWLAIALAAAAGIALGLIGRRLYLPGRGTSWPFTVLGGVGGALLGLALVGALVTSLPIQRNPANTAEIFYPPRDLPAGLSTTLQASPLVGLGRSILFFPLLPQERFTSAEQGVYAGLHGWLVVGEPWNER